MSKRENTFIFMLFLLILGQTLVSCKDDEDGIDETLPWVIENLPSAENVRSTSAYIPVNEKAHLELRLGFDENLLHPTVYGVTCYFLNGEDGFHVDYLEPSRIYYYTMVYYKGKDDVIYSKQTKSFTTQDVSVNFIEPFEGNKLRVKVRGVEESDVPSGLHVEFYRANENGEFSNLSLRTTSLGDAIWENECWWPSEGDRWKAVVKCNSVRVVAETPVITFVNGKWEVGI